MITNFQILNTVTKTVKPSQYSNRSDYISDLYKETLSFIQDNLVDDTDSLFTLAKNNGKPLWRPHWSKGRWSSHNRFCFVASALLTKVFDSKEY